MKPKLKTNDPTKAKAFFEAKVAFTTGPVEVKYFMDEGERPNIIDVRAADDYEEGHVPGALSLPEDQWATLEGLRKEEANVIYCYSEVCHLAARACVFFAGRGFPVIEMDGGFSSWQEHELPIEGSKAVGAA
jgi:rhodanese-related sulfurtransferase